MARQVKIMAVYEIQDSEGTVTGPFAKDQIIHWIGQGHITRTTLIRFSGSPNFTPAETHAEFRHAFRSTAGGSKLIPSGNPASLAAYYLGIFSCFPLIGSPLAIIGLIQGIKGLKNYKENPAVHGKTHAIVGIVCSSVGLAMNSFMLFGLIAAFAQGGSAP